MSDGRKVIYDQKTAAERLLTAVSNISDEALELVLDTDTAEKYEALAATPDKEILDGEMPNRGTGHREKGSWITSLYKVVGIAAACFIGILMVFSGMSETADYVPPIEDSMPVIVVWKQECYQIVTEPEDLQVYGLEEVTPRESLGQMVSYLHISGANEYEVSRAETDMVLYTCKDREDVYILQSPDRCVFVVLVEE